MGVSFADVRREIRTRLVGMTVATTGSTTLAATATGYTRASGSFITDKFEVGMEITASGFGTAANNGLGIVTRAEALTLTVSAYDLASSNGVWTKTTRTLVTEGASSGRTLLVGLPTVRAWEGVRHEKLAGVPWVEERLVGGPSRRRGTTGDGEAEATPQYGLTLHCVAEKGTGATDRYGDALFALLPPGQGLGTTARVRGDTGMTRVALPEIHAGFTTTALAFPLRIRTTQTTN
ncbi:MAG: hypothetical protein ACPGVY_11360 [Mycobacterium sp.]